MDTPKHFRTSVAAMAGLLVSALLMVGVAVHLPWDDTPEPRVSPMIVSPPASSSPAAPGWTAPAVIGSEPALGGNTEGLDSFRTVENTASPSRPSGRGVNEDILTPRSAAPHATAPSAWIPTLKTADGEVLEIRPQPVGPSERDVWYGMAVQELYDAEQQRRDLDEERAGLLSRFISLGGRLDPDGRPVYDVDASIPDEDRVELESTRGRIEDLDLWILRKQERIDDTRDELMHR